MPMNNRLHTDALIINQISFAAQKLILKFSFFVRRKVTNEQKKNRFISIRY